MQSISILLPRKEAASHGIIHQLEHAASSSSDVLKVDGYMQSHIAPKSAVMSVVSNLDSIRLNRALNQEENKK